MSAFKRHSATELARLPRCKHRCRNKLVCKHGPCCNIGLDQSEQDSTSSDASSVLSSLPTPRLRTIVDCLRMSSLVSDDIIALVLDYAKQQLLYCWNGHYPRTLSVFDPEAGTWTQEPVPTDRSVIAMFGVEGHVTLLAGFRDEGPLLIRHGPSLWQTKDVTLSPGVMSLHGGLPGNQLVMDCKEETQESGRYSYIVRIMRWMMNAPAPVIVFEREGPMGHRFLAVDGDDVYTVERLSTRILRSDRDTKTWVPLPELHQSEPIGDDRVIGRSPSGAMLDANRLMITGGGMGRVGWTEPCSRGAYLYDKRTQSWHILSTMHRGRFGHEMLLLDGKMVVTSGGLEVYDPVANQWSSPLQYGYRHAVVL